YGTASGEQPHHLHSEERSVTDDDHFERTLAERERDCISLNLMSRTLAQHHLHREINADNVLPDFLEIGRQDTRATSDLQAPPGWGRTATIECIEKRRG